jgi:hypothetical protein
MSRPTRTTTAEAGGEAGQKSSGILRRKCACGNHTIAGESCDECSAKAEGTLRRRASAGARTPEVAPPIVHGVLASPGQPLDSATRAAMEPRFGHDFSGVRVHTDDRAAESARRVGALAYTVGERMVFNRGSYAPGSAEGRKLLAHELTHVVQQRSAGSATQGRLEMGRADDPAEAEAERTASMVGSDPMRNSTRSPNGTPAMNGAGPKPGGPTLRRAGFIESIARFFGGGTFDDKELEDYLAALAKNRAIEGNYDSDNKAREVVKRWKAGDAKFAVITIPIRILLIKELISGYTGGDDEAAILDLIREAVTGERTAIFTEVGIGTLRDNFSGDNLKELNSLIDAEQDNAAIASLAGWTAEDVMKLMNRHGDESAITTLVNEGYKVLSFKTAFDKWKNADGSEVEEELTGLRGNTCKEVEDGCPRPKEIRIRASLPVAEAAATLFHEIHHVIRGDTTTREEGLKQEIDVRVDTEEYRIKRGLPPTKPSYRKPDGTVDRDAIDKEIHGSSHYNPTTRERIGRRYVDEVEVKGWHLPGKQP